MSKQSSEIKFCSFMTNLLYFWLIYFTKKSFIWGPQKNIIKQNDDSILWSILSLDNQFNTTLNLWNEY